VVQLRVQAAVVPEGVAGATVVAIGAAATQAFLQFMTCVSQLTRQAVEVCEEISGVGTNGAGCTCPGIGARPGTVGTACASRIRSAAQAIEQSKAATRIARRRT
jgi:hypothetical protein